MEWRKLKVASPADAVLVERILWQNCATVAQIELALLVPEFYSSKTNCKGTEYQYKFEPGESVL